MKVRLKNIGKQKMKKINLNELRRDLLKKSKKIILENGWNENLFYSISKNTKFKIEEINVLFPNGYKSLLRFYLKEINFQMTDNSKNLDLINMKSSKKIKELILLKLKNNSKEKDLIKKTFYSLLLPTHSRIASQSLFNTADQMWFLAGDNSTDFNYYSKRFILSVIYTLTLYYWVNNDDIEDTKKFIDKQLIKVSKIPKFKSNIKNIYNNIFA